jgi:preprotein translocase subunit SecF
MIINAVTVIITLAIVAIAVIWGLQFVRKFALQIAMENHDAVKAMDQEEETQRLKKEKSADAAAATAFAKVQPLVTIPKTSTPSKPRSASPKPSPRAEGAVAEADV